MKTGVTYWIEGLIGAEPERTGTATEIECPECGGSLRAGQAIDAVFTPISLITDAFELDEPFGLVDEETSLHRVPTGNSAVDDWVPMQDHRPVHMPPFVCNDCGVHPERYELQDEPGHGQILANEAPVNAVPAPAANMAPETVGLATGGAKDVTNFRDNVANGYTPQPEAISDEGLFYDYYFDTGEGADSDALTAPRYAAVVTEHPLTGEPERYLSVGLDSTLSIKDFERPRLDLVAVLDTDVEEARRIEPRVVERRAIALPEDDDVEMFVPMSARAWVMAASVPPVDSRSSTNSTRSPDSTSLMNISDSA